MSTGELKRSTREVYDSGAIGTSGTDLGFAYEHACERGGPSTRDRPYASDLEVHAARVRSGRSLVLLGLFRDDRLGRQEQRRDRRRVLQSRTRHLRRVDDPRLEHVPILTGRGVQTLTQRQRTHPLGHNPALKAGVDRDLLERLLQRTPDDRGTSRLIALKLDLVERTRTRLQQRHTTTGNDALLNRGLRVADGVLDTVLTLLQLHLRRRTRLDDGHTAGQLGKTLLQLLAVIVRVAVLDLDADLVDATRDVARIARAIDDGGLVLGHHDALGLAEHVQRGVLQLEADVLGDDVATGQDGHVGQHRLAAVTETGGLHGHGLQHTVQLVEQQCGERLGLHVVGDDGQRPAGPHDLFEDREQVLVG